MKIVVVKDYEEMSLKASEIIVELLKEKKNATLGLATGSSPIGIYKNLIKKYKEGEISFKDVTTYNLDEYCELPRSHPESYYSFMHRNLFSQVDINEANVNIPCSEGDDLEALCKEYNDKLNSASVDLQLLGIGANGHIGFNEPNTSFEQETFIVKLTEKTRLDNQRFFNSLDEVPKFAMTMGIKNIMNSKKILLVASGKNKAEAVKKLASGVITEEFPASVLNNHKDVIVFVDEEAAEYIK